MKISLVTTIMPEYTLEEIAKIASDIGYQGLEIRVKDTTKKEKTKGYSFWGNHKFDLGVSNLSNKASYAKETCDKYKLEICMLATYLFPSDFEKIEEVCKNMSTLGCRKLRVWAPFFRGNADYKKILSLTIKDLTRVEKIVKRYKVQAVLEIHHGTIASSASLAFQIVKDFDPKYIGVIYDPGNLVIEGFENYNIGLQLLNKYVAHVHIKNSKLIIKGKRADKSKIWVGKFCNMLEGFADIRQFVKDLKNTGYKGWLSNEDFSTRVTREKLQADYKYLRDIAK